MSKFSKGSMRLRRADGRTYLARRRISTPWFRIFLHKMEAPDPGFHLHDHPWNFVSLILWGGYTEEREFTSVASERAGHVEAGYRSWYGDRVRYGFLNVNRMPLYLAHRIVELNKKTCWTLVIGGRRQREWGFYQPDGWVFHSDYDSKAYRGALKTEGKEGVS